MKIWWKLPESGKWRALRAYAPTRLRALRAHTRPTYLTRLTRPVRAYAPTRPTRLTRPHAPYAPHAPTRATYAPYAPNFLRAQFFTRPIFYAPNFLRAQFLRAQFFTRPMLYAPNFFTRPILYAPNYRIYWETNFQLIFMMKWLLFWSLLGLVIRRVGRYLYVVRKVGCELRMSLVRIKFSE